jgi:hypothetical protein
MRIPRLPLIVLLALSCEKYDGPPEPSLPEANGGLLADPSAPLVVQFSKPIDPSTLRLEVARNVLDDRGRLADEIAGDAGALSTVFQTSPELLADGKEIGSTSQLSDDHRTLRITHQAAFPLAPKLVLVVEPGLKDAVCTSDGGATVCSSGAGSPTTARRKIAFGFSVDVQCSRPTKTFPPMGTYFFVVNVAQPVGVQVRLFAKIRVDPATGKFSAAFIRAGRVPDPSRCNPACKSTEACRTLPGPPVCVVPSERATSPDEYPDFYADAVTAASYQFVVLGCIIDQPDGSAQFVNLPVDITSPQPPVVLVGTKLTSTFAPDMGGGLRGAGTLTADSVLLFGAPSGKGTGELRGLLIPAALAAPYGRDVPEPP